MFHRVTVVFVFKCVKIKLDFTPNWDILFNLNISGLTNTDVEVRCVLQLRVRDCRSEERTFLV